MDEKLNPETQEKEAPQEVNAETLEQVNGGYTVSGEEVAAADAKILYGCSAFIGSTTKY